MSLILKPTWKERQILRSYLAPPRRNTSGDLCPIHTSSHAVSSGSDTRLLVLALCRFMKVGNPLYITFRYGGTYKVHATQGAYQIGK